MWKWGSIGIISYIKFKLIVRVERRECKVVLWVYNDIMRRCCCLNYIYGFNRRLN